MESNRIPDYFTLNNGLTIPSIGLGTSQLFDDTSNLIFEAIKSGVRFIDSASKYGNEDLIGVGIEKAINEGIVKREELFIVSKLWVEERKDPESAITRQLERLRINYLDLYLIHWPYPRRENNEFVLDQPMYVLWGLMEQLVYNGYTKSIGVSNFNVQLLFDMLCYAKIKPAVLEIEINPFITQKRMIEFCNRFDIIIIAFNSLCSGWYVDTFNTDKKPYYNLFENETVLELSKKYSKTPGQILLNFTLSKGICVIPKSGNIKRIQENMDSKEFVIEKEDIVKLEIYNENKRFCFTFEWEMTGNIDIFA